MIDTESTKLKKKYQKTILERVQDLESFQQFREGVAKQIGDLCRVVEALVSLVGVDDVNKAVLDARIRELEEPVQNQLEAIKDAVEKGLLVVEDSATSGEVLLITSQKAADGTQMYPSRVIIPFQGYSPDAQVLLTGKKVGDFVTLSNGSTVEVVAIYKAATKTQNKEVQ